MVLIIDTSGSMAGYLNDMARRAATMVINTLTEVDYVTIVKYSSRASEALAGLHTGGLWRATDATKDALIEWIYDNIDASGTTNFRAAFQKAWEVVDATTASSNCNRIMLFLSDGEDPVWIWTDAQGVGTKAASYNPPMHVLTYGLGPIGNAAEVKLKDIACRGNGIYYSVTADTIANTMASYFQVRIARLDG